MIIKFLYDESRGGKKSELELVLAIIDQITVNVEEKNWSMCTLFYSQIGCRYKCTVSVGIQKYRIKTSHVAQVNLFRTD